MQNLSKLALSEQGVLRSLCAVRCRMLGNGITNQQHPVCICGSRVDWGLTNDRLWLKSKDEDCFVTEFDTMSYPRSCKQHPPDPGMSLTTLQTSKIYGAASR